MKSPGSSYPSARAGCFKKGTNVGDEAMTKDQVGYLSFIAGMLFVMTLDLMWRAI